MNQIKFSENWNNKLNNNIFTTIRGWNKDKEDYYKKLVGSEFEIVLNGKVQEDFKKVRLIDSEIIEFSKISRHTLMLDTGQSDFAEIFNIFNNFGMKSIFDKMIILTFRREK
jgi:hypothetical protein